MSKQRRQHGQRRGPGRWWPWLIAALVALAILASFTPVSERALHPDVAPPPVAPPVVSPPDLAPPATRPAPRVTTPP